MDKIDITVTIKIKPNCELQEEEVKDKYHEEKKPLVRLLKYMKENNL